MKRQGGYCSPCHLPSVHVQKIPAYSAICLVPITNPKPTPWGESINIYVVIYATDESTEQVSMTERVTERTRN